MPGALQHIDERLMGGVRSIHTPTLDRLLVAITQTASYSKLWLLLAGVLAMGGGRRGRRAAGNGVVAIGIASLIANGPAKLLTRRRRPVEGSRATLIDMPSSTSFPSGHSASAFAFATRACAEMPSLAPLLVPLAGTVAYSRIYVGVHYPSDVAAGAAIGIGAGVLAGRIGASRRACTISSLL
jgi:undecaprenyl-diphosphatase